MAKFEINEIAIFSPPPKPGIVIGGVCGANSECQIKSDRFYKQHSQTGAGYFYYCEFPGDPSPRHSDGYWAVREESLRKKKPPQELSSWEKIQEITGWNPTKENINVD